MSIRDELKQAIFGQESNSGRADTSQENYAGARGPMQVTKSTFEGLKAKGRIPANYDHANPEHTTIAGNTLIDDLFDKYGDAPDKVAAAYYGGEKAVLPDGSIANLPDLKNPKAPTVHQYVRQVMGRMGQDIDLEDTTQVAPRSRASVLASWDTPMPGRPGPRIRAGKAPKEVKVVPPEALGDAKLPEAIRVAAEGKEAEAQADLERSTSFLDKARAAWLQNTFMGSLTKWSVRPEFETQPSFTVNWDKAQKEDGLGALSEPEVEFLSEAVSPDHQARITWEIKNNREDQATINRSGTGVGIAATLFAGLPEGYLTGMGASRLMALGRVGSARLLAQGEKGAALASLAAENIGGNLALTAVQDKFDPYISITDYGMAVTVGGLGASLGLHGIFRKDASGLAQTMSRMQDSAAAQHLEFREQALRNLGAEAPTEALQAEMKRLESNSIRQTLSAGQGEIPASRRLLEDTEVGEERIKETTEALAPVDKKTTEASVTVKAPSGPVEDRLRSAGIETPLDTRSGSAILSTIKAGEDALASTLAGRLLEHLGTNDIPVHVIPDDLRSKVAPDGSENWRGVYLSHSNEIALAASHAKDPYLALHEISHALSVTRLHAGKTGADPRLAGLYNEINSMREVAQKAYYEAIGNGELADLDGKAAYYFKNEKEFLAGLYSGNRAFNALLKRTKVPGQPKTLYSKFVEAVTGLLGINKNDELDMFTHMLNKSDELMSQQLTVNRISPVGVSVASFDPSTMLQDPTARKHGLDLLPMETPTQQAEVKAMIGLYKRADAGGYKVDEKRLSRLLETAPMQGAQSTANTLARSKNPVARMIAAELLENPSGSQGRRSTASLAKYLNEKAYLGNTLNEVQAWYKQYRLDAGGSVWEDMLGGKQWEQFNRLISEEIEARRMGVELNSHRSVKEAADSLEKAYERLRKAQVDAKTIGWGALPESSVGYMPHRMDPAKVISMSNEQARAVHQALTDQFINISGFDLSFSDKLASRYLDLVRKRATGAYSPPMGIHQVGAAEVVEEALEQMGMSRPEIIAMMKKYQQGGAGHTKKRLNLDLSQEYPMADGSSFKLMDLMDTNQFNLLRNQARRVSGEVALARHGVMGKPGLKLLRRAMDFGADGERATPRELEAFDQIAAEFLGDSFGTHSRNLDRLMQFNSLARLGGMGFTQLAEGINGIFHIGVAKAFGHITDLGRLRSEIKALARGEKVDNPLIGSLEAYRGAEFGTDAYKHVFPFDSTASTPVYGHETLTFGDRLLRGGGFVQGKLSMWRTIHSVQQRGMAEQIVSRAAEYIHAGKEDVALRDMGISPELAEKIRQAGAVGHDGTKVTGFDVSKLDPESAEEFVQAVHRGVSQIIQGTFIGEQGKWAHDGFMRLLSQFRTFSLTSVEKQWARQVGNVGTYQALGFVLASMSVAAPIYMARTYLQSIGRPDQEAYLEKQLAFDKIARATLNYIAMSGLSGDALDVLSAVTGVGAPTGGRQGAGGQSFVGNVVAPAAGVADDLYKAIQNTKDGTDPHALIKNMPFSRIPYLIPAIQSLGS